MCLFTASSRCEQVGYLAVLALDQVACGREGGGPPGRSPLHRPAPPVDRWPTWGTSRRSGASSRRQAARPASEQLPLCHDLFTRPPAVNRLPARLEARSLSLLCAGLLPPRGQDRVPLSLPRRLSSLSAAGSLPRRGVGGFRAGLAAVAPRRASSSRRECLSGRLVPPPLLQARRGCRTRREACARCSRQAAHS